MKLDKIPLDIRSKSIKEAQNEIKDILEELEKKETKLEESIEKYNRMVQLNLHIHNEFKRKSKNISILNSQNKRQN
jgi:exonuclease VII small subunit